LSYNTVYSAVVGTPVSQALVFTTATIQTAYSNWAAQIQNLYNEYRVLQIRIKIVPVPNVSAAGLFSTGLYATAFEGPTTPAQTIAAIQRIPTHRLVPLNDRTVTLKWFMKSDPEDRTFVSTANPEAVVGGIIGFVGAAAPTLNVTYMTVEASYLVEARGRII